MQKEAKVPSHPVALLMSGGNPNLTWNFSNCFPAVFLRPKTTRDSPWPPRTAISGR